MGVVRLRDARVLLLLSVPILPARVHVFQGLPALSNRLRRPDAVHGEVTALVEMRNLLRAEDSPAARLGQCQLGLLPADRVAVRSWKEAAVVPSPAGGFVRAVRIHQAVRAGDLLPGDPLVSSWGVE